MRGPQEPLTTSYAIGRRMCEQGYLPDPRVARTRGFCCYLPGTTRDLAPVRAAAKRAETSAQFTMFQKALT